MIKSIRSNWDKIELYIISLWLLFLIMFILTIDIPIYFGEDSKYIGTINLLKRNIISVCSLLFLILGLVFYGRFKYKIAGSNKTPIEIIKIENFNYKHLTFITTYIVPLIGINFNSFRYVMVLFILLIAIGAIYIRTDLFYANPTLALLGFHIYRVNGKFRTEMRNNIIVIAKEPLEEKMKVSYKKLDKKIYFVRGINGNK